MIHDLFSPQSHSGEAKLFLHPPDGPPIELAAAKNLWPYTYAHAIVSTLAAGGPFCPSVIYVEFENVASSGASVAVPASARSQGVEYYLGLSSSPTKDYLRIAIASSQPARDNSYSGTQYLPAGMFNQLIYQALVYGSAGVNGKPFSNAANSKVYGTAVAVTPVPGDRTRDVVWACDYFAVSDQWIAPTVGSYQVQHALTFQ